MFLFHGQVIFISRDLFVFSLLANIAMMIMSTLDLKALKKPRTYIKFSAISR